MERAGLVIIGNGMAGHRFVADLCRHAPGRYRVTVIGAEPVPAYNRVLLSALLAGDARLDDLTLTSPGWYADRGATLLTGVSAVAIDPAARQVALSSGDTVGFDYLVLATGSEPIRLPLPGTDLDGVMTFRDVADTAELQRRARSGARAVVIGGGLLGLETAYGLRRLGARVTVVHLMDRLMERQLDDEAAALVARRIAGQGIGVLLAARSEAIEGAGAVSALRLGDGRRIPCDLVVMAAGIRPRRALAVEAGLACNRGIVVDDRLATSAPGIFALGECAEHRGVTYGLVEPLYEQAAALARRFAGDATAVYGGSSPYTSLKVSGIEVFSAGALEDVAQAQRLTFRDPGGGIYKTLQIARGADGAERLAGAVLVGDRRDGAWYAELIARQTPVRHIRDTLIFGRDITELAA